MSSLKLFRWLFSVASFYFSFIHLYIFVFVVHWTTTSTTATKTKTFKNNNNNKTEQNEVEKHHALYLSVPLTGNESTRCFARTLLSNSFALISFHFMVLLYCISVWFFFSFHPPSRRCFTHHSFTLNSHNISWNFILAFCVSLSLPVSIAFFSNITFYSPVLLLVIRYYFYFLCCCFCVCENQFTRFAWFPFGWNDFFLCWAYGGNLSLSMQKTFWFLSCSTRHKSLHNCNCNCNCNCRRKFHETHNHQSFEMCHLNADTQHTTHILSKRWSEQNIAVVVTQPHCRIVSSVSSCFYAETIELSVPWCKRQIFIWLKQCTRRRKAIMKREKELQTIFLWISRLKSVPFFVLFIKIGYEQMNSI